MTEEEIEVARAFVACERWKWLPGMRALYLFGFGEEVYRLGDHRREDWPEEYDWPHCLGLCIPDITDDCTRGGILKVVRDATGRKHAYLEYVGGYWAMVDPMDDRWPFYWTHACASEAEALLRALQAAPEVKSE